VKIFPVLSGSSNRSGQNYRKYGNDNRLNELGRVANSHNLGLSGTFLGGSKAFPEKKGNAVKTSYIANRAQFDADEISLVEKNSPRLAY
jgi:hypothetical protein